MVVAAGAPNPEMRLDKWLVYARFCKTRSQAAGLVTGGNIRISGRKIEKPDAKLHEGDILTMAAGDQIQLIRVIALAARRGSPQAAYELYEIMPLTAGNLE